MYGKLFSSMYDGTLYGQWQAIVTLQQLVILADADGVIDMTPPAISARTSLPLDIIEVGLEILAKPDPYSRTPGEEGRRIKLLDEHRPWGWYIVNHEKYRDMQDADTVRAANRERKRLQRLREQEAAEAAAAAGKKIEESQEGHGVSQDVTEGHAESRHTDTDTDTETDTNKNITEKKSGKKTTKGTRLPETWALPQEWERWTLGEWPHLTQKQLAMHELEFFNYWTAKPGAGALKLDWFKTWQNWMIKAVGSKTK